MATAIDMVDTAIGAGMATDMESIVTDMALEIAGTATDMDIGMALALDSAYM
jgi:hypothetical protein